MFLIDSTVVAGVDCLYGLNALGLTQNEIDSLRSKHVIEEGSHLRGIESAAVSRVILPKQFGNVAMQRLIFYSLLRLHTCLNIVLLYSKPDAS